MNYLIDHLVLSHENRNVYTAITSRKDWKPKLLHENIEGML